MFILERGQDHIRLLVEEVVEDWRDENAYELGPNMQGLLPHAPPCYIWDTTLTYLENFGNGPYLVDLPIFPIRYHDADALLPLPATPLVGSHSRLSRHVETIEDSPSSNADAHQLAPLEEN